MSGLSSEYAWMSRPGMIVFLAGMALFAIVKAHNKRWSKMTSQSVYPHTSVRFEFCRAPFGVPFPFVVQRGSNDMRKLGLFCAAP